MKLAPRVRFWVEMGLALLCGSLALLTFFWQDWIEALTGRDPDQHSGSLEWTIIAVLLIAFCVASFTARVEWRRARLLAASSR